MLPASAPDAPRHPIAVVAARTGLAQDILRIWERRYRVVEPHRSETGRRLYTDADVERLNLLRLAVESGRRISDVAPLTTDALRGVAGEDARASVRGPGAGSAPRAPDFFVDSALAAIEGYDGAALDVVLRRATLEMAAPTLRTAVLQPVIASVGDRWRHGTLRIANEHMATAVIRTFLGELLAKAGVTQGNPRIVVSTPAGQRHELGALLATLAAREVGWNAIYLGPDLPAVEIAAVVRASGAVAVALSVTSPADTARLASELSELRELLGADTPVFVGGAAATFHAEAIAGIGGHVVTELDCFQDLLTRVAG